MYIITLTLTDQKHRAPEFMAGHNEWIARNLDDGLFLLIGSLKPQGGGVILAHDADRSEIEARVAEDPFVREGIATPQIQEVSPGRTDPRLAFLLDGTA